MIENTSKMKTAQRWLEVRRHAGRALLLAAFGMGASPACSLLNETAVQCLSEAECTSRGPAFENTTCSRETKTCVPVVEGEGLCATNQECLTRNGGTPSICRKSDHKCVVLQTAECPSVMGKASEVANDNTVVFGAMTPANFTALGLQMDRAVAFAQQDFSTAVAGLPPVSGSQEVRPVVIVACNEFGAGVQGIVRAGNHLVKDLKVPLVIGPVDSGNVITANNMVLLPNGVMSIAPTSPLSGLATLPNPAAPTPLIWRPNASDAGFAAALAELTSLDLEKRLRDLGIAQPDEPIRVALLVEGNLFGVTMGNLVQQTLRFNGKSVPDNATAGTFQFANYGDQFDPVNNPTPDAKTSAVIATTLQFKPHVVIHGAALIAITKVLVPLELNWPAGVPKPIHIGMNASWQNVLLTNFIGDNANLRKRVFVARAKAPPPDSASVAQWSIRFKTAFPEFQTVETFNPLVYFWVDSTYLSMFAAAAVGSAPLTSVNLANAMSKLVGPGPTIHQGPDDIGKAFSALSTGGTIAYEGLSGPIKFDLSTGGNLTDTEFVCPTADASGRAAGGFQPVGFVWNHTTGKGSGTVTCP